MFAKLAEDLAELPDLLEATRTYAGRILAGLDSRPVAAMASDAGSAPLPESGEGLRAAMAAFAERWEPGFAASAGPRYLGFVTGGSTPAALAGDWLTSTLDQNAHGSVGSSAVALEREAVAWLGSLFGLDMPGAFVTGATMSNLVGLAIGREWLGTQLGVSVTDEGLTEPVRVLSGTPHSSIGKSLSVLGIGRKHLISVPTLPDREAADVAALERELAAGPAIVVANAGTVNTVDFDDIRAIADLKARYPFWLHVDAAFGGFAAVSPAYAELVDGWSEADSVCIDLHKWLNVPYDSAVQFTRRQDLQVRVFENQSPYLGAPGAVPDPMHLTPETSRRLRALPAWFALSAYGREGYREIVERNIACAQALGSRLAASPSWRLLAPVRLNVVCFTPVDRQVPEVLDALSRSGEAFLTPTVYQGVPAIRAAFSNWRTTMADVDRVCRALGV
ncbi:pyridoxal-dependent decarboxylase [Kutzneria sp. 744]|uniref:pyridoxal phosphate-dependent decarboxylase family protein n=1 Tax=Kutzneria sp. (strain 744) TaxID=345341 RepID=UPI0004B4BD5C|nr:pyridoxal-dependent decarboxylase [Kutzneria sp. 744]